MKIYKQKTKKKWFLKIQNKYVASLSIASISAIILLLSHYGDICLSMTLK